MRVCVVWCGGCVCVWVWCVCVVWVVGVRCVVVCCVWGVVCGAWRVCVCSGCVSVCVCVCVCVVCACVWCVLVCVCVSVCECVCVWCIRMWCGVCVCGLTDVLCFSVYIHLSWLKSHKEPMARGHMQIHSLGLRGFPHILSLQGRFYTIRREDFQCYNKKN